MKVRVRLAPSPTGFLHVGTAQSALYNWLFARSQGGSFLLRIEDTDIERSTKEYEQSIIDALEWLGVRSDEPVVRQSERMASGVYKKHLDQLLESGKAFYCHHTKEELEEEQKKQNENKEPQRHVCEHKNSEPGKKAGGIIRLAVEGKKVSFNDRIRGMIEWDSGLLGDFSIARDLDHPLYNFAVVVDDAEMQISHVIRGEDHISNTPKQILIYEALGISLPEFAHLPLILATDRSKLSKRHGATAVVDYKKDYLPEALANFLGSLSYTFSKEIISKEEMVGEFQLSKVHKSGAAFDIKKLNWLNSQWIKNLEPSKFLEITGIAVSEKAVPIITERLEKISEVSQFSYLWEKPEYEPELLNWKDSSSEDVIKSLEGSRKILENISDMNELRPALDNLGEELRNRGLVYWPLRVALTGKDKSPDPVQIIDIIGKEKTLERIDEAIEKLK